jgi:transcriptional regulator with XRE-family HTH domain
MELNVGMNIKRLRLAKGLTQEQLADLLTISTAAVSKWEAKSTYPDITMLFPLAEIFGVTVDELLGYDEAKAKADVDKIIAEYQRLGVEGRFAERTKLIVGARKKYPHDYRIMTKYMWDKAGGEAGRSQILGDGARRGVFRRKGFAQAREGVVFRARRRSRIRVFGMDSQS